MTNGLIRFVHDFFLPKCHAFELLRDALECGWLQGVEQLIGGVGAGGMSHRLRGRYVEGTVRSINNDRQW